MTQQQAGMISAASAFLFWGVMPLYWQPLGAVAALEVTLHRIFWGAVVAWIMVLVRRRKPSPIIPNRKTIATLTIAGALVSINWLTFVVAVTSGRTFDASLGYYINPLVSVFLGMIFFGERLTRLQWVAFAFAASGVAYLTIALGEFPWASLILAGTFGTYGLIKKRSSLRPVHGLAVELSAIAPITLLLIVLWVAGFADEPAAFLAPTTSLTVNALLVGGGLMTVIPLVLFGMAAQRIRLADVGFMQYIAPTTQFIVALTILRDPLEPERLIGFILVWIGLAIYIYSAWWATRGRPALVTPPPV